MRHILPLALATSLGVGTPALLAQQPPVRPDSGNAATTPPPQQGGPARRDPTNALPLAPTRTARFTTDAGTWMSVDISPDGQTIAFDLLGDIYTLPMAGGKATRIIAGNSIDGQPRFSPDGRSIVFTSDRSGVDATWIADADGRRPRLISPGGSYPDWSPDGRHVVVNNRLVDVRGGAGLQLTGVGTAPSFTGDGRFIWFQNGTQAARYDRQNGTIDNRTNLPGGALRPMVTRDGKRLAYFTRYEAQSALVLRDLETGREQWVTMGTQPEGPFNPVPFQAQGPLPPGFTPPPPPPPPGIGPLPSSAWTPDESAIVTSFGGKLWKVDVPSGRRTQIPFTADVEQSMGALVRGALDVASDSVVAREIREPALSPDGRRVAFTALGKVYVMDLPGGTPRRLTSASGVVETSPTWTPDGRSIAYATWVDAEGGDIHMVEATGTGTPRNITRAPAMYTRLNYTPDGSRLVFARAPRRSRTYVVDDAGVQARTATGAGTELGLELRWIPAVGGAQTTIAMVADVGVMPQSAFPHFTTGDTSRVFFHDGSALRSVRWDGSNLKAMITGPSTQTVLSPDGMHVLSRAGRRRHIYMYEAPHVADSVTIDPTQVAAAVPVRRLTRAGGDFPTFSRDGSKAVWTNGTTLYVYDVAAGDKATADSLTAALSRTGPTQPQTPAGGAPTAPGAGAPGGARPDSAGTWSPAYDATSYTIRVAAPADKPTGVTVLRGGRALTMKGREVIENADIVITGNRITAVGARGTVTIPKGARTIDVKGKTILPGYVDVNAQIGAPSQVHRTVVPQYLANLAFGVTTVRDPETQATDVFTYGDRVATGELIGPRVFGTGPAALDSAATMRTAADARNFLGLYATGYRSGNVRGDLIAPRIDRQRFLTTAKDLGLTAVAMGSPDFRKGLSAILDGYSSHQGAYEIFPLHDDVAKLIAESGIVYTPMQMGRVGTRIGFEHILATETPHSDPKMRRFYFHRDLDRITRTRTNWMAADEYPFEHVGAGAARIVNAGGKVALGTGGRLQGLGMHYEMWLLAKGGMPTHDILRAATIFGAEAIGAGKDLGSIEAGKLADLQVLDANPLTAIRNTNSVRYVMTNGRLYDAMSMDQVTPTRKKMTNMWWMEENR